MLLKSADNKENQLKILKNLLGHEKVSPEKKQLIDRELRNLKTGIATEKQAAYELDFYFGPSPKAIILHDLRLEIDGRVAQIDHLILTRLFEVYVLETKTFSAGLAINSAGEFSTVYDGKEIGIPSPIQQNARHVAVLRDAFKSIGLPRRLGVPMMPNFVPVVLVSPKAVITRTESKAIDITSVIKLDQFMAWYTKKLDNPIRAKDFIDILKVSSFDTIKGLAEKLVALHIPGRIDYIRRFDLTEILLKTNAKPETMPRVDPSSIKPVTPTHPATRCCESCNIPIAEVVAKFCLGNFRRFKGYTYCRPCQAKH